jgi:hypothetical protein
MKAQVPIAALASVALLAIAAACDRRDLPSAPAASSAQAASKINGSSSHAGLSASVAGEEEEVCTNAGLKGGYGFYRTGTTGGSPFAAVGLATYDGAGNWAATETISRGGVFTRDAMSAGQYEMSADCSGKMFSGGQEVARFALADRGRQLFILSVTPGETISGVEKKVARQGCTTAGVDGVYPFYRTGTTPAGPLAALGLSIFDGAGNNTATQTIVRNGTLIPPVPITAFYEVSADCTGRLITAATGQPFALLVVVEKGKEIFSLSLSAGNTVTAVFRRQDEDDED